LFMFSWPICHFTSETKTARQCLPH
jgi:hypothetical protein